MTSVYLFSSCVLRQWSFVRRTTNEKRGTSFFKQLFFLAAFFMVFFTVVEYPAAAFEGCCCTRPVDQSPLWPLDNQTCSTYSTGVLFQNATVEHDCRQFCTANSHEESEEIEAVPNVTVPTNKITPLADEDVEEEEVAESSEEDSEPATETADDVEMPDSAGEPESDEEPTEIVAAKTAPKKQVTKSPVNSIEKTVEETEKEVEERVDDEPEPAFVERQSLWWLILLGMLGVVLLVAGIVVQKKRKATKTVILSGVSGANLLPKKVLAPVAQTVTSSQTVRAPGQQKQSVIKQPVERNKQPRAGMFVQRPVSRFTQQLPQPRLTVQSRPVQQKNLQIFVPKKEILPQKSAEVPVEVHREELPQKPDSRDSFAKLRQIAKK